MLALEEPIWEVVPRKMWKVDSPDPTDMVLLTLFQWSMFWWSLLWRFRLGVVWYDTCRCSFKVSNIGSEDTSFSFWFGKLQGNSGHHPFYPFKWWFGLCISSSQSFGNIGEHLAMFLEDVLVPNILMCPSFCKCHYYMSCSLDTSLLGRSSYEVATVVLWYHMIQVVVIGIGVEVTMVIEMKKKVMWERKKKREMYWNSVISFIPKQQSSCIAK